MAVNAREQLKVLQLSGVTVEEKELGRGSYGVVVEVNVNGLKCAGKKLHPILLETSREECGQIIQQFVEECFQHSRQRHPKIVQLLGVYFPSPQASLPLMVLEMMEMTLSKCLDKYPNLPLSLKNDMLIDVAQGLLHLHNQSPPIIHRDLTSNNVLLNSHFVAKIADLGVAKIIVDNHFSRQFTKQPGTVAYMPPEALSSKPTYNTKLDVFSFGVLTLHMCVNKWPVPTEAFVNAANSGNVYCRVPEIDRRKDYLAELKEDHTHMNLIRKCLQNDPNSRPSARDVLDSLQTITNTTGSYSSRCELICQKLPKNSSPFSTPYSSKSSTSSTGTVPSTPNSKDPIVPATHFKPQSPTPPRVPPRPAGRNGKKCDIVVALYTFEAQYPAENLSFNKGEKLKIINKPDNTTWLAHSLLTNKDGWIPSNHVCPEKWYCGKIKQVDAQRKLLLSGDPNGSFLIRESDTYHDNYSLVVRFHEEVKHYRIQVTEDGYFCVSPRNKFHSIDELIKEHMKNSYGICCRLVAPCPMSEISSAGNWEIQRSQVSFRHCTSADHFGEIWEGSWMGITPVAIKMHSSDGMTVERFIAVAEMMRKFNHENLLQVYGLCKRQPTFMVTEYIAQEQLIDYLQKMEGRNLELHQLTIIAKQIANGMKYLEERQYIHRDLAARNIQIMIAKENIRVKIADFSLTIHISDTLNSTDSFFPIKWTAPEAAKENKFTSKSDVWSFGILLMETFTEGHRPYPGIYNKELLAMIERGYRMPRPRKCPQAVYQVMMKCWNYNPAERPTFYQLKDTFNSMAF